MRSTECRLAPAKITRSLRITGRRPDGYHLIEAEMLTIDLADTVEFAEGDDLVVADEIAWQGPRRPEVPEVPADASNLVVRALALSGGPASVRLTKRIPPGGGLGGGSADAAAVLRWRGVTDLGLAARLGADVPFCLLGGRAMVRGVGELIEPLDHEACTMVVVTPGFGLSTPAVYRAFDELAAKGAIAGELVNDLEPAARLVEPRLARLAALLAEVAGRQPVLAGSGSSYFLECAERAAKALEAALSEALMSTGVSALVTRCRTLVASPATP